MPELCAGFKGEKDMDFEGDAVVAKRQSFPGKPTDMMQESGIPMRTVGQMRW